MRNSAIGCACLLAVFEGVGITMQRMFAQQPLVSSSSFLVLTFIAGGTPSWFTSSCTSIEYTNIPCQLSPTSSFDHLRGTVPVRVVFWVYSNQRIVSMDGGSVINRTREKFQRLIGLESVWITLPNSVQSTLRHYSIDTANSLSIRGLGMKCAVFSWFQGSPKNYSTL